MPDRDLKLKALDKYYPKPDIDIFGEKWKSTALEIAKENADLKIKLAEVNEFIRDIAKLLGEDDLGFDGKTWSIEDFREAIENYKRG